MFNRGVEVKDSGFHSRKGDSRGKKETDPDQNQKCNPTQGIGKKRMASKRDKASGQFANLREASGRHKGHAGSRVLASGEVRARLAISCEGLNLGCACTQGPRGHVEIEV